MGAKQQHILVLIAACALLGASACTRAGFDEPTEGSAVDGGGDRGGGIGDGAGSDSGGEDAPRPDARPDAEPGDSGGDPGLPDRPPEPEVDQDDGQPPEDTGPEIPPGGCLTADQCPMPENHCLKAVCTPAFECVIEPDNGKDCVDGDPCTELDVCLGGECKGFPIDCEDQPCMVDYCNEVGDCVWEPRDCGEDSNDACVEAYCDVALDACAVKYLPCQDDGVACTIEACVPNTGCVTFDDCQCAEDDPCPPSPNPCIETFCEDGSCAESAAAEGAECDDGDLCTYNDKCTQGVCLGKPTLCDGGPCLVGVCNTNTGLCESAPLDCDDDNPCTTDTCDAGIGCDHAFACDDGIPCTVDICDESGECSHDGSESCPCDGTPTNCPSDGLGQCEAYTCVDFACQIVVADNGTLCNDGDPCTDPEVCISGSCMGLPIDCSDDDPCTVDSCGDQGCSYEPIVCYGNPCALQECQNGGCVTVDTQDCDDGKACTVDFCDPETGECHNIVACEDNDLCTVNQCNSTTGQCETAPVNCADDNACTADFCDPATGGCVHPATGDACECKGDQDCSNPCFSEAFCQEGSCVFGEPLPCPDLPCSDGVCDFYGGCLQVPTNDGGFCMDEGVPGICTLGVCLTD